ncbi:MAG TPA: hypothetical protein DHW42_08710 [Candidatus Marinimicrobia bacterium]|nr:hypothetical protein [Candidatus Neomarinimicrobiota bacterium]
MIEQFIIRLQQSAILYWLPKIIIDALAVFFYVIPLIFGCLLIYSIIYYFQNHAVTAMTSAGKSPPRYFIATLKSYISFYKHLFTPIRHIRFFKSFEIHHFLFMALLLVNITTISLIPFNHRLQGFKATGGIYILLVVFLVNIAGFIYSGMFLQKSVTKVTIIRHFIVLAGGFLVIGIALTSLIVAANSASLDSLIAAQKGYLLRLIPAWNLFSSPFNLIQGLCYFLYFLIIFQAFTQVNRPIPNDFSDYYISAENINLMLLFSFWKYSFLILFSLLYTVIYTGAFLSPFNNSVLISNPSIESAWLLIKLTLFWVILIFLNRSIPDLIQEQIIKFTYRLIIPLQFISLTGLIIISIFR